MMTICRPNFDDKKEINLFSRIDLFSLNCDVTINIAHVSPSQMSKKTVILM